MRSILCIMLLGFGMMVYAVDLKPCDNPQLIDMELVEVGSLYTDLAVSVDATVISDSDSRHDTLENLHAIILNSPKRVEALPGYKRSIKTTHRIESTESYKGEIFVPHRIGSTIYE